MEYVARFPRIEVRMARIEEPEEGEPERVGILVKNGDPVCVVESKAFDSLYQPLDGDEPAPRATRRPARKAVESAAHSNGASHSATNDVLLKLVAKRPYTSGELIEQSGLKVQTVYVAMSSMKKQGRVETRRDDENDGQSKWYITEAN